MDLTTGAIYLSPGQKSAIEKHGKRISLLDGDNLKPAENSEVTIDQVATAKRLSEIIGQPVSANDIQYFTSNGVSSIIAEKPAANI